MYVLPRTAYRVFLPRTPYLVLPISYLLPLTAQVLFATAHLSLLLSLASQVCAAGAILNLLGPELGPETESNEQRQGFKKLLSCALSIGMVQGPLRLQQEEMLQEAKATQPPTA